MNGVPMHHSYLLMIFTLMMMMGTIRSVHNYGDALSKSILFFEGQRSGKLPPNQRMSWRKDSALRDGFDSHVDLVGGYYDAGDNVKFNFPMAFSITMLSWNVLEFRKEIAAVGSEYVNALEAVRWGTDYLMKSTSVPGVVFAQVGDPYADHNCWDRPEDMDTARTSFAVSKALPGSEVSAEIAAALAAAAMVFRSVDRVYSARLLTRAKLVFEFADKYRGSYNTSLGKWVCPFYCDYSGYEDELVWAAAWLYKATKAAYYKDYLTKNIHNLDARPNDFKDGSFAEFGWDDKHAGINVLVSKFVVTGEVSNPSSFIPNADRFICSMLPESPSLSVSYSPGGLLFKSGGSNLQHATALSFLLVVYGRYMNHARRVIDCGNGVVVPPARLVRLAKGQVDYILGTNPLKMSYMVGYGSKFPKRIHHRGSSLPSKDAHPAPFGCQGGSSYFASPNPNPNLLVGAIVGGPDIHDLYDDSRDDFVHSEPTTYINAPLVGLLAYFNARSQNKATNLFD